MELLPYSLLRITGLSFDVVEQLDWTNAQQFTEYIAGRKQQLSEMKADLCDSLLEVMQSKDNPASKNKIQNLRRDIFNDRVLKRAVIEHAVLHLDQSNQEKLNTYLSQNDHFLKQSELWSEKYCDELLRVRKRLQKLSFNQQLLKGISFSSQQLLHSIRYYQHKPIHAFGKKDVEAELGLFKYITRMACKTSPYSTFTSIAVSGIKSQALPISYEGSVLNKISGHVRLNTNLFTHLKGQLLKHPNFHLFIPLRLNPTLKDTGDSFRFLANHRNVEIFRTIFRNPIADMIVRLLQDNPSGFTCQQIYTAMKAQVATTKSGLIRYLQQLIDCGLIELDFGISGNDPDWDLKFIAFLEQRRKGMKGISKVVRLLKNLRKTSGRLSKVSAKLRAKLILKAHTEYENTLRDFLTSISKGELSKAHAAAVAVFKPGQIFYEDTTIRVVQEIGQAGLEQLCQYIDAAVSELNTLDYRGDEKRKMIGYFLQKYDAVSDVPVLTFYEDYYRDVKLPEENDRNAGDRPVSKWQEENKLRRAKWEAGLIDILESETDLGADEVNVTVSMLRRANNKASLLPVQRTGDSVGCMIQLYTSAENGHLQAVLNGVMQGYGKLYSRFLHIVPEKVADVIIDHNRNKLDKDLIHMENMDAACHNSNIHPCLFDKEIQSPGSNNSSAPQDQLSVADFVIRYNEVSQNLDLIYLPENRPAKTYDLGYLGLDGRSKLFLLLNEFSDSNSYTFSPVAIAHNKLLQQKDGRKPGEQILMYPRIVLEGCINLRRKNWIVPKHLLPLKREGESDMDYFASLNVWRKQYQIPAHVFVSIDPERSFTKKNMVKEQLLISRDDYKPQYISFDNPFMVNYLEKMMRKVPRILKIDEALPAKGSMALIGQESRVTENIIQWYTHN